MRDARMHTAIGSTHEVIACLDLGVALGYVAHDEGAMNALSEAPHLPSRCRARIAGAPSTSPDLLFSP